MTKSSYIQFTNEGNNGNNGYSWIKIGSSEKQLSKNDIVKLVMDGDQTSGTADMNANKISNFSFNVKMYINGKLEGTGTVTGIYIAKYSVYDSNLTYKLPQYLSGTQLQVDGNTLINWWPENNSEINLYNIGPSSTNNEFLRMDFNSGKTYFDCSGDYEIVSS